MLTLWKSLNESGAVSDIPNDFDRKSETRSVLQLYNDRDSTKDSSEYTYFNSKAYSVYRWIFINFSFSGSLQANSLAASRVERALSSAASTAGTPSGSAGADANSRGGPMLRLRVWLLLAELYLALGGTPAAAACVTEAANIFPLSHQVMYMVNVNIYFLQIV